jgi:hypothetical protein
MYINFTESSSCGYSYQEEYGYHVYGVNIFGADDMCNCDKFYDGNLPRFFEEHFLEAFIYAANSGVKSVGFNMAEIPDNVKQDFFPTGTGNDIYPMSQNGKRLIVWGEGYENISLNIYTLVVFRVARVMKHYSSQLQKNN